MGRLFKRTQFVPKEVNYSQSQSSYGAYLVQCAVISSDPLQHQRRCTDRLIALCRTLSARSSAAETSARSATDLVWYSPALTSAVRDFSNREDRLIDSQIREHLVTAETTGTHWPAVAKQHIAGLNDRAVTSLLRCDATTSSGNIPRLQKTHMR